jgi:hypothetical protein
MADTSHPSSGPGNPPGRGERSGASADDSYLAPYRKAVESFGASFESTLWASRRWQRVRFAVACDMQDMTGRVVMDAGSGLGGFAEYLRDVGVNYARYVGLEGVPEMTEKSASLHLPRASFHHVDFAADPDAFTTGVAESTGVRGGRPDVIIFSGSLNTFTMEAAQPILARAWDACNESLVFNFLSDRVRGRRRDADTGPARRFDTAAMLDWALERTEFVALRHDYLPDGHDATIVMRRAPEVVLEEE